MTVGQLIEALQSFDEDTEVRLAFQRSWPFEFSVQDELACCVSDGTPCVYIAEQEQIGYLPTQAREELGWS